MQPQIGAIIAAHPIRKKPYNAIKFVRFDGFGTPLYRVAKDRAEMGAASALKVAFGRFGAHCFHCKQFMAPQVLSHLCTRDHLRAKANGGKAYLHNLVFACGPCNRNKGRKELINFNGEAGVEYLKALDEHLQKCIEALRGR
jgi:5-methylcytosine-specific restriction endonuclease McrA